MRARPALSTWETWNTSTQHSRCIKGFAWLSTDDKSRDHRKPTRPSLLGNQYSGVQRFVRSFIGHRPFHDEMAIPRSWIELSNSHCSRAKWAGIYYMTGERTPYADLTVDKTKAVPRFDYPLNKPMCGCYCSLVLHFLARWPSRCYSLFQDQNAPQKQPLLNSIALGYLRWFHYWSRRVTHGRWEAMALNRPEREREPGRKHLERGQNYPAEISLAYRHASPPHEYWSLARTVVIVVLSVWRRQVPVANDTNWRRLHRRWPAMWVSPQTKPWYGPLT